MTSDGLQLKSDMMFDAITSTGKDEYTIMIYNREVLTTDISSSILALTEQARTEPTILPLTATQLEATTTPSRPDSPSNKAWGSRFQRTFEAYVDHIMAFYKAIVAHAGLCEHIMDELRMQSLAVQVALTNLDAHSRSVLETFEKFNAFATKELTKQARLIQSFPRDIEALRQIRVHPALLPPDSPERYISDFIPTDKLILWAERCREIHEGLLQDGKYLSTSIKEVQEGTVAIRSNSGINLSQLEDAMGDILLAVEKQNQIRQRAERDQLRVKERVAEISRSEGFGGSVSTVEALGQLAEVYKTDYITTSRQSDEMLREKLGIFISAKRSQTANLISQLMHISKLQSTIASIPPSLANLDDALRKRDADFSQLVYVQRIPIAYGALVVEIVRRREYSMLLLQKSKQLAEVMSRFKQMEQRRRDSFRSEVAKFVPVVVPGLDDAPPFCEINALHTRDRLPPFTREHVAEFERLVNQLSAGLGGHGSESAESHILGTEQSMAGASSISGESNQDALAKLRVTLVKMTAQMDLMGGEFDRILEKSFLTEKIQRLEEDNAKLRADMSRVDIQQRSGTPQLAQLPFPRHNTPVGGTTGSVSTGSSTAVGTGGVSTNAPASPKLSRQPSRGGNTGAASQRTDTDDQQTQQQTQQIQRLTKENGELLNKNKAYETRIRSLEDLLYQNYRTGSSADSSVSSKVSRHQLSTSPNSDQPWNDPEGSQIVRSQPQAKEQERNHDEERLIKLEQELQEAYRKLEQAEANLRGQCTLTEQVTAVNDELRQEILELKLLSATSEESDDKSSSPTANQRRADELEDELKGMIAKHDHLLQQNEREKEIQALETKAFKDRIEELTNQQSLEKEILEGQLDQAKRSAEEASERVIELENELEIVNEELQNKVLELEEELENHAAEHKEVTARAEEQERQLESYRAVHDDILAQLKDREKELTVALENSQEAKEVYTKLQSDYSNLQDAHSQLEQDHTAISKSLRDIQSSRDELAQQVETLRKQVSDLEAQRESNTVDVNMRLEEAKTMVRRAEADWKEKSRLLEQMERATKDLSSPLKQCLAALSIQEAELEISSLENVQEKLKIIENGIHDLVKNNANEQKVMLASHDFNLAELLKENKTSQNLLNSTIASLEKTHQEAKDEAAITKQEMESTISLLREELENIKTQQRASAIPVPLSTTPISGTSMASISPATPMPPTLPYGLKGSSAMADSTIDSLRIHDRVLLSTLALDLGIHLPTLSSINDQDNSLLPTSSVLLDQSEKTNKSGSTSLAPTPATTASVVSSSTSGSSRSSSITVPLPKDILQTFDFTELNVAEVTALIKKKQLDTEHLLKRWQRECKNLKEKYNRAAAEAYEKIAFRNFKVDDLTLFLPTRNSISKPWAAFNINFPHYFLHMTPSMSNQLRNREWIVARITSITEAVVDKRLAAEAATTEDEGVGTPSSSNAVSAHNPFGLADGVKYYLLDATSWNGYQSHSHGHGKSSSYHSSSGREGSNSKLRHHSSTSALNESSSSRREHGRSRDRREREYDSERRKHREQESVQDDESTTRLKTLKENREEDGSLIRSKGEATIAESDPPKSSHINPSLLSLLQHGSSSPNHPNTTENPSSSTISAAPSSPSNAVLASEVSKTTGNQTTKSRRPDSIHFDSTATSVLEGLSAAQLPPTNPSGVTGAGNRSSMGAIPSGSAPISIPYQSAATNALRAISSSVGSTGSGGSGSVSSLIAHQLGGSGSGSGSGSATTALAANSPPRPMILSSSPHKIGVSTVSATGATVSISNTTATGTSIPTHSHNFGYGPGNPQGGSSPNLGSSSGMFGSSNVPVHPSRLSTSSNRDDMEQFTVFATDEDQEEENRQQQQQKGGNDHFILTLQLVCCIFIPNFSFFVTSILMQRHTLDIPEILSLIGSFLPLWVHPIPSVGDVKRMKYEPKTLVACLQVSKHWYKTLLPILWYGYWTKSPNLEIIPKAAILRHSHLLKVLHLFHWSSSTVDDLSPFQCTDLTDLSVFVLGPEVQCADGARCMEQESQETKIAAYDEDKGTITDLTLQHGKRLLRSNHLLLRLSWHGIKRHSLPILDPEDFMRLKNLERLILDNWKCSGEQLEQVIRTVSGSLKELKVSSLHGLGPITLETSNDDTWLLARLGSLHWSLASYINDYLPEFVKRCPNLRSLELPMEQPECDYSHLSKSLRANCPYFDTLDLNAHVGSLNVEMLIREASTSGLRELRIAFKGDMKTMAEAILEHASTLEKMCISPQNNEDDADPGLYLRFLLECPGLKSLGFHPRRAPINRGFLEPLTRKEWACRGLEELNIQLGCFNTHSVLTKELRQRTQKALYKYRWIMLVDRGVGPEEEEEEEEEKEYQINPAMLEQLLELIRLQDLDKMSLLILDEFEFRKKH
ncbi:oligomeric, coiled-coil, peripheral membrane protein [Linnemannia zychae]|nr:oligomeric, coiled-coil, peripheral membrane protein [Linnemannia zychae]